jgi:hypothetical protein
LEIKLRFLEQMKLLCHLLIITLRDRWQIGQIRNILEVRIIVEVKNCKRTWKHLNRIKEGKIPAFIYMYRTLNAVNMDHVAYYNNILKSFLKWTPLYTFG